MKNHIIPRDIEAITNLDCVNGDRGGCIGL